jgi:hypothetical protein
MTCGRRRRSADRRFSRYRRGESRKQLSRTALPVRPEVYEWLVKAESKGKFVNRLVRERYRYERLDDEQVSSEQGDLEQLLRDSLQSAKSKEA